MNHMHLAHISLLVDDYDKAIRFYVEKLGFKLLEDTALSPAKRWVIVQPPGGGCSLLLAKAANAEQVSRVGNQTGGRVFFFYIRMIFNAIMVGWSSTESSLYDRPVRRRTALWPFLKISTATGGIWWSRSPGANPGYSYNSTISVGLIFSNTKSVSFFKSM